MKRKCPAPITTVSTTTSSVCHAIMTPSLNFNLLEREISISIIEICLLPKADF